MRLNYAIHTFRTRIRAGLRALVAALPFVSSGCLSLPEPGAYRPPARNNQTLFQMLGQLRAKHGVPALAAAVIHKGKIVSTATVGTALTDNHGGAIDNRHRFHIGSTTKGVTALLTAILVREGQLSYDTSVGQILGELPMRPEYRSGGLSLTVDDFARYALENLNGLAGRGKLLTAQQYRAIHSVQLRAPLNELYQAQSSSAEQGLGYGWGVVPLPGGARLSAADGSGGTFYARVIVLPYLDLAFVGMTNAGNGAEVLGGAIGRATGLGWWE